MVGFLPADNLTSRYRFAGEDATSLEGFTSGFTAKVESSVLVA